MTARMHAFFMFTDEDLDELMDKLEVEREPIVVSGMADLVLTLDRDQALDLARDLIARASRQDIVQVKFPGGRLVVQEEEL